MDPSLIEEMAGQGQTTFVLNIHRELCTIRKSGMHSISCTTVMKCINMANSKVDEMTNMIKSALKEASK